MKKLLDRIFIDGLGGMAQGLFATLIIGTIIQQIGLFMGGGTGDLIYELGKIAAGLTGAGIGVGVARKLEAGCGAVSGYCADSGCRYDRCICRENLIRTGSCGWKSGSGRAGRAVRRFCGGVSGDRDRDLDLG